MGNMNSLSSPDLFENDGSLLLESKKSTLMDQIESMMPAAVDGTDQLETVYIFDGMAVLNKIKLGPGINNCLQLAKEFLKRVCPKDASEIRVVFDNYYERSLKSNTQSKRLFNTVSMQFEVQDDTVLEKVTMKKFLSHILTKQRITTYLGNYLVKMFVFMELPHAVSFQNKTISDIPEANLTALNDHNHEEADTLMILHAADVAYCDPKGDHLFS